MASGQPFSEQEKEFIRQNADRMSKGMIAQELGRLFPDDNGGYRSWRSVRSFLYRESISSEFILTVRLPAHIVRDARRNGVSMDEIGNIAQAAILDKIRV